MTHACELLEQLHSDMHKGLRSAATALRRQRRFWIGTIFSVQPIKVQIRKVQLEQSTFADVPLQWRAATWTGAKEQLERLEQL